ncbi:hypothetical protein P879_09749 [Paragonimus westermani]|uniref:Carbohydrate kinase PfkB domain-containing protein n=1 Tax=Paragonimus westermani TaxID=34504 RepID=A0A8T0DBF6_9TREM|nr:hypothetical protein P879_09749 [Paragonimus westermani]
MRTVFEGCLKAPVMVELDVVVVGSINTDLSVFTSVFPDPGETVIGSEFVTGFGGKGANQSVAAKLLGCKVALVAKVGNDGFGKSYLAYLKETGINCSKLSNVGYI